jgi:Domain of unknown function (DUF4386)
VTSLRRTALVAGLLYLATFVAGIPPSFLYDPVLKDPSAVLGAGNDGQILWGVYLDLVTAMAGIGTAVALYSVVKRQHEGAALGFVTTRVMEGALIFMAALSMLTLVSLRQESAGASDPATLTAIGQTLVDVRNGAHLLGPGLMPAFNACLLGYVMYRSGLVPRWMPTLGLIGAPLLFSSSLGTLFGINDPMSAWTGIATIPIFIWELSIGLYMTFKGFRPNAQLLVEPPPDPYPAVRPAAAGA